MSDTPKRRGVGGRAGTLPVKAPPLPPAKPARKRWEYLHVAIDPEGYTPPDQVLDQNGAEGWELVSVYSVSDPMRVSTAYAVFKREITG